MRNTLRLGLGVCLVCLGAITYFRGVARTALAFAVSAGPKRLPTATGACDDHDGDGFGLGCARGLDCNDHDATMHPGQRETCNLRDDDCNGEVDDAADCARPGKSIGRVFVRAGEFVMGSAPGDGALDEQPRHRVWLSDFWLDQFEVTNGRYRACVQRGVCARPQFAASRLRADYFDQATFADYPVVFVDVKRAETYCRFAGGQLPTEAQWEKAARGPSPSIARFPWGDREPDCTLANLGGARSCVGDTDRVGRRPAGQSPTGAMDMAGNVWEWVADLYDANYYGRTPARDPRGPETGTLRIVRGGCFESGADSLRVSCRKPTVASTWAYNIGFRCAYGRER